MHAFCRQVQQWWCRQGRLCHIDVSSIESVFYICSPRKGSLLTPGMGGETIARNQQHSLKQHVFLIVFTWKETLTDAGDWGGQTPKISTNNKQQLKTHIYLLKYIVYYNLYIYIFYIFVYFVYFVYFHTVRNGAFYFSAKCPRWFKCQIDPSVFHVRGALLTSCVSAYVMRDPLGFACAKQSKNDTSKWWQLMITDTKINQNIPDI